MDGGKWVIMFPEGTRSERGKSGSYKTGAAASPSRLTQVSCRLPCLRVSGRRFRFIPIAVSIGPPISPRVGESSMT